MVLEGITDDDLDIYECFNNISSFQQTRLFEEILFSFSLLENKENVPSHLKL